MRDQRWPGDYQTISQEFASSKAQEQAGMNAANESHLNDPASLGNVYGFDRYQRGEMDKSWSNQLDTVGMQPHTREYLEQEMNCMRSERKFEMIAGQLIDYTDGIQFSGRP